MGEVNAELVAARGDPDEAVLRPMVAARLRAARERCGYDPNPAMAQAAGVSEWTLRSAERADRPMPSLQTAYRLCRCYGLPLAALYPPAAEVVPVRPPALDPVPGWVVNGHDPADAPAGPANALDECLLFRFLAGRLRAVLVHRGGVINEYAGRTGLSKAAVSYLSSWTPDLARRTLPTCRTVYRVCEAVGIEVGQWLPDPARVFVPDVC